MFTTSDKAKFDRDLTKGSVVGQLLRFSMPFLLTMLIQQSFSMADLLIVSHFSGEVSVAGVNNGGQLTFFVIAIAIGLSVGGTILIGQYYGANKMEDVKKTASTVLTLMIASSVVMAIVLAVTSDIVLRVMQVPVESHREAWIYLNICMIGLPFIFIYNAVGGIMRGLGDAKRPLVIVAISCGMNILLSMYLVGYHRMGAAGAALGTIISQATCVIVASLYLSRSGFFFDFKFKSFVIHRDKLRLILKLGIPSGISQIAVNLSFLLLVMLVNSYGVSVSAAAGLAGRLNGFAIMPVMAISSSISMMCAQNLGARKHDRAIRTMVSGIIMSLFIAVPLFFIVRSFAEQIMGLMSNVDAVVEAGSLYMRAFMWDYLLVPFVFCFFGLATGAGHTHITMINTFITSIALRIPSALFFSRTLDLGLWGVGISVPVASAGALLFLLWYVLSGRWRTAVTHRPESATDLM